MKAFPAVLLLLLALVAASDAAAQIGRGASPLRVGAAKVDVSPADGKLPGDGPGILDRLYARAIVLATETSSAAPISCPGRERTNQGRAGFEGTYKEGSPAAIRLGLLRIGDVMIGAVNAEVFNAIAQRLKRESPYKATMMATLTNGSARSGYIPDDASFGKYTFEVLSSRVQPGCAESSIVNGILALIDESSRERD